MATVDQHSTHYKTIDLTCMIANIAYLILRVFYLILFIVSGLYVMVWYDAATILFYIFCFFLIKKKKYYLYALCCGNEFFAFIITASVILGFATGFYLYLIGLCIVSFFTTYFSTKKKTKNSLIWAGMSVVMCLALYLGTEFNPPYYVISKWLEITLFTTHIIVVFLFVVFYLLIFVKYAITLESRIINESRTDELTEINNRYGLYDYYNQEQNKPSKALALFDIDDFKMINDKHGHVTGDYVLKEVAKMATTILKDAFVCRYGGEEFVVVLNKEGSLELLEEFRKAVEKRKFEYEGEKLNLTITIGVAQFSKDATLEKWVNRADEKMYSGKKSGKNKIVS